MAARSHCEKALKVIAKCMDSEDEKVSMMAASIMLDRGYGRPAQKEEVATTHAFVIAPDTMDQETWLKYRGQPQLVAPDAFEDVHLTRSSSSKRKRPSASARSSSAISNAAASGCCWPTFGSAGSLLGNTAIRSGSSCASYSHRRSSYARRPNTWVAPGLGARQPISPNTLALAAIEGDGGVTGAATPTGPRSRADHLLPY